MSATHRRQLAAVIDGTIRAHFPRWKRSPEAGARFLFKADPEYAVLAVQTATNLSSDQGLRAGSLREHLAASLLTLVKAVPGTTVFDPFMGTGTILKVGAAFRRGNLLWLGGVAGRIQARAAAAVRCSVEAFNTRFEDFALDRLPAGARLVSNVPFGHQFRRPASRFLI